MMAAATLRPVLKSKAARTAWSPTVEYALCEFAFALHLFTETIIENEEALEW